MELRDLGSWTKGAVFAYLGVAVGLGEFRKATDSLGVLGANVTMMVVGAVATLALQDVLMRRTIQPTRDG